MPPLTPLTVPVVFTVATAVLLLLKAPPADVSVSVMLLPAHSALPPLITPACGNASTVTAWLLTAVPHPFVTL